MKLLLLAALCYAVSSFSVVQHHRAPSKLHAGFGASKAEVANPKLGSDAKCGCGSQVKYVECCQKIHTSQAAPSPELLIQSRYSAYANDDAEFIIATTSSLSPDYAAFMDTALAPQNRVKRWAKSIRQTMITDYFFTRFEIESVTITRDEATVAWHHLAIGKADNSKTHIYKLLLL